MKRWLKPAVFAASLLPLARIAYLGAGGGLGANPIEWVLNDLGFWTLTFVCITLACTPAKILAGWNWPLRVRRMLGLFAFFYGVLHFGMYAGVDQLFDFGAIGEDIVERPFIAVGVLALVLMTPLAVTSTNGWVKRLGFARWKMLHRGIYVVAWLGVIHYWMRVKADVTRPAIFAGVVTALLAVRLLYWWRERRGASASPGASRATP